MIEKGEATHGQLGVTIQSNASREGGNTSRFTTGARVATATADSPAGKAGVQSGDIIVGVGGKRVVDATDVTATVRSYAAGAEVPVKVKRGDNEMEFKVTLGAASVG
ncbi:PDZ domain-containing protein [Galactobacter caseinivorans]|uniref:PDZ domain-containing protein n=2 Tax=Galactobacter caseinivorans TaxID=2676123 RepID=A0A496PN57_9MICC|nr:PDZ domain-containing protein [Galactobacter caseinivorans]